MCGGRPSAPPPPPPPPPPPAPPAPAANNPRAPDAPRVRAMVDDGSGPNVENSINQINKKGRSRLKIDPTSGNVQSEGSGLNIPQ